MPTASRTRVKRTWRARLAGEEFSRNGERSELSTRCHFPLVGFSEIEMNDQQFPRQGVFSCKRFAWIKFRFAASILTSAVSYRNPRVAARGHEASDRKSTRLNSSHLVISDAVFCLRKKALRT